jgi:hypothetical protein
MRSSIIQLRDGRALGSRLTDPTAACRAKGRLKMARKCCRINSSMAMLIRSGKSSRARLQADLHNRLPGRRCWLT